MTRHDLSFLSILVVDDSAYVREIVRDILAMAGTGSVLLAGNGAEAMRILRFKPLHLLITDLVMAPMDGFDLLRWIRASPSSPNRRLPVILLTGHADPPTISAAWRAGATDILVKPISSAMLIERIAMVAAGGPRRIMTTAWSDAEWSDAEGSDGTRHEAQENSGANGAKPAALPPPAPQPSTAPPAIPNTSLAVIENCRRRIAAEVAGLEALAAALDRDHGAEGEGAEGLIHALHAIALDMRRMSRQFDFDLVADIAASLCTCLTRADTACPGYRAAVDAHVDALRWAIGRGIRGGGGPLGVRMTGALQLLTRLLLAPASHGGGPDGKDQAVFSATGWANAG